MKNLGVNSLIGETEIETINNVRAFLGQMSASLESDPDNLGLLLSLQLAHNALSELNK